MLSPGEYHEEVPKESDENQRYRWWLIEQCKEPVFRQGTRAACRDDILFYINSFCWQFNPDNLEHEVEPFITYDFQDRAIVGGDVEIDGVMVHEWGILECVEDQEDARWPKSRKMGASWIAMEISDWLCKFHTRKSVGVLSRDEDSVDQTGDPNSLFWKIDFLNEHQPDWLKGKVVKKKMRYLYEDTDSIIVGEANTASAFVSGRATLLIIDEFGQFKNGAETHDQTSSVSFCRIYIFTHKEQAGMAYELCFDAKYKYMREIKTHWTQHPIYKRGLYRYDEEKNQIDIIDKIFDFNSICAHGVSKKKECKECRSGIKEFDFVYESRPVGGPFPGLRSPWYDKECRRRSERDVAMNLDIDPRGATDKFFDPYRIKILQQEFCTDPYWRGSLNYNRDTGQPIELREEPNGLVKLWVNPKSRIEMPAMRAGAGADISAGTGSTPSCLSLFSADTGQKVLEYIDAMIFANQFAEFVVAMCRMFRDKYGNTALLSWEIQGGSAFGRRVRELGYERIYIKKEEDKLGNMRDNGGLPGVATGPKFLPVMQNYRDALYERQCVNRSQFAIEEALKFVHTNKGVEYKGSKKPRKVGDEGSMATIHHGDIVTADAIGWKMVEELGLVTQISVEEAAPYGSLAWRRKKADNVREEVWA